jgi:2-polyprenyl-3-methyl-5-hydroxy-6-metoxy-1,4-benzoquinol methylase
MDPSAKFWDGRAESFDAGPSEDDPLHNQTVERARPFLQLGDQVLDVGCATGQFSRELAGSVVRITGIDISEKMVTIARGRAQGEGLENLDYLQATAFDPRLTAGSYDVVLAFNVLHLVPDASAAVRRIADLLRPGGRFISVTPCLGDGLSAPGLILGLLNKLGLHKRGLIPQLRSFRVAELEHTMTTNGFDLLDSATLAPRPTIRFLAARLDEQP